MKEYAIHVSRYNPKTDDKSTLKEYEVPHIEQGTVLEALQYIYEEIDSSLLFSYGCRSNTCGKCAININGKPGLACETSLEDGMVLEPLENFPIIRDLAVDRSGLLEKLKKFDIVFLPVQEPEVAIQPPEFFELIMCNECLSCLSACPIFSQGMDEGSPFFGVKLAELHYDVRDVGERFNHLQSFYNCTTCKACSHVCPMEIKFDEIVESTRKTLFKAGFLPNSLLQLRDNVLNSGNVYTCAREERIGMYPPLLRGKAEKGELKGTAETLLFMGCVPSYLDMKIVPSFMELVEAIGTNYTTLSVDEMCCGFPLYLMGSEDFEGYAQHMIERLSATGAHVLITPCAGCYKTFRKIYPQFGDLGMEVYHSVQYLEKTLNEGKLRFRGEVRKKVTYHDPCDLGRTCLVFEEPRNIIKNIPGVDFVEMERNRLDARCCGGGGDVQVHNQEMAMKMAAERVRDALAVGAEIIVSACPACKDNLRKGSRLIPRHERGKIKIQDITEIVDESIKGDRRIMAKSGKSETGKKDS